MTNQDNERPFRVGDVVFSEYFGLGKVTSISPREAVDPKYSVEVHFDADPLSVKTYTRSGRYFESEIHPTNMHNIMAEYDIQHVGRGDE